MIGVASDEVEGDAGSGAVERVDCNEAHFSVEAGGSGGRGEWRQGGVEAGGGEAGGMEPHNYM